MFLRLFLVVGCLATLPALLESAQGQKPVAQKPGGQKSAVQGARPYLPGYRAYLIHRRGWHKVDYKVNAWMNVPVADQNTAKAVAKNYRMNGWTTQIVRPSKGVFVVKAKMHRWRTATYTAHRRTADSIAWMLRYQGYEARVAY